MGTPTRPNRRDVLSVVACVLLAACTSTGASSRSDASMEPAAGSLAQTAPPHSPSVAAPGEGAAPPELEGRWRRGFEGAPLVLTLEGNGYYVQYAAESGAGRIFVDGDQITFSNSNRCDGTGTYTWSFENGRLRFTLVGEDPCGRVDFLLRATFGRVEP